MAGCTVAWQKYVNTFQVKVQSYESAISTLNPFDKESVEAGSYLIAKDGPARLLVVQEENLELLVLAWCSVKEPHETTLGNILHSSCKILVSL